MSDPYTIHYSQGPLIAISVHAGHDLRPEVQEAIALDDIERLYEEDPYTDDLTRISGCRVVVHRSRFEVDLNRPRTDAVYRRPDQSWGLRVWKRELTDDIIGRSLAIHDRFYEDLRRLIERVLRDHGMFVVYDLHSYNHRRDGPDAPVADPRLNPDINVGTSVMDPTRWRPVLDAFNSALRSHGPVGRTFDVREDVRFRGGYLSRWVNGNFADGCSLAIEVKKFFMDERSGRLDERRFQEVLLALRATVGPVETSLADLVRAA